MKAQKAPCDFHSVLLSLDDNIINKNIFFTKTGCLIGVIFIVDDSIRYITNIIRNNLYLRFLTHLVSIKTESYVFTTI